MAVMQPPPRREVDAEGTALVLRMHARSGPNVEDSDFEHVARLRAFDMNGPRQQVNAETFARTAGRAHDATGATPHDVLAPGCPAINGLRTRIASDHQIVVVAGVMRQRFDRREIAGGDFHDRCNRFGEISPVHGFRLRRNEAMPDGTRFHRTCCRIPVVTAAEWAVRPIRSCLGAPKNLPKPAAASKRVHGMWARLMQM